MIHHKYYQIWLSPAYNFSKWEWTICSYYKNAFYSIKVALIKQSTMQHTLSFSIEEKQGKYIFSSFMIDKNKKI